MGRGSSLRGSLLSLLLFTVLTGCYARDVSDILFENEGNIDPFAGHPQNITAMETFPGTVSLRWDPPRNSSAGLIGYQVLYWRPANSSYQFRNVSSESTNTTVDKLHGFTWYFFSVRSILMDDRYSLAAAPVRNMTISRAPDGSPQVVNHTSPYLDNYNQINLFWDGIDDNLWNGINNTYVIDMFDVTVDVRQNNRLRFSVTRSSLVVYNQVITDLEIEHDYLVYIYASSSGGLGEPGTPHHVFITSPTVTPTVQPETQSWQFYVIIIPSVIAFAIFIAAAILCAKLCCSRRNVTYIRDINKNIEDGTMMSSRPMDRMSLARISNQHRPLPPNPHTPTPSAQSVNARLIKDYSPPNHAFMEYPQSYPHQQPHPHMEYPFSHHVHHHHRPLDLDPGPAGIGVMDTRMRANSATSPQCPTLSQPLSDMSSVTPTSVFAESNPSQSQGHHHPQRYPSNRSPVSPTNPNPYEVPNESDTGHHSVSPPGHMHTLPGTRRPHTANPSLGPSVFYPSSSHHQTSPPFSQSNAELFQLGAAPPIPPHRSNTNIGLGRGGGGGGSPQDADYSEIPDDSPTDNKPPPGRYDNEMIPSSSPLQSDQYNSYSDIPTAVSPYNIGVIGGGGGMKESPGHSSLSESISSFSTDSQSASPVRGAVGATRGVHVGSNVSPPYRGRGNSHTNGNIPRTGSKSNNEPRKTSPEVSAPYLSPTSIKSSSNSESRTTSSPSQ